jgi:hypothetical protein
MIRPILWNYALGQAHGHGGEFCESLVGGLRAVKSLK